MSQHYSDPSRESDAYSLPDVEVWQDYISVVVSKCGDFDVPRESHWARGFCPSCERATCVDRDEGINGIELTERKGWFYWYCFPGCLPDSEPYGPYATEQDALDAAQDNE